MEKEPIFNPESEKSPIEKIKKEMITEALDQYEKIFPTAGKSDLSDCFTISRSKLIFWFNTEDESTHVIARDI